MTTTSSTQQTLSTVRQIFMAAFDDFATNPTDIAAEVPEVGNVRYARELLGLMVHNGLLVESDVNGEEQVWQNANGTLDDRTREEAEAEIDAWLANTPTIEAAPVARTSRGRKQANPANLPLCLCGCAIPGKSLYRPGHDARHAGNLARGVLAGEFTLAKAVQGLSGPLTEKVAAQVAKGNSRKGTPNLAKTTPATEAVPAVLVGTVKIGRWTYQAEMTEGADSLRYRKNADAAWIGSTKAKDVAAFTV